MSEARYATLGIGRYSYEVALVTTADGTTVEMTQDQAREHHAELNPPGRPGSSVFQYWWEVQKKQRNRKWAAELITAEDKTPIDLGDVERSFWGFPVQAVMRVIEQLSAEGWRLIHVSEDHGLYSGADAPDEAYLTRVRYLLSR